MASTSPTSAVPPPFPENAGNNANGTAVPVLDPAVVPNIDDLVTEDGLPVDNIYTEKQQRLFTEPLYSSWVGPGPGRSFLALANVAGFTR